MTAATFVPLSEYREYPVDAMQPRRRSTRICGAGARCGVLIAPCRRGHHDCLRTAGTAPNGANLQPWHSWSFRPSDRAHDPRHAEKEEHEFYRQGAAEWLRRCPVARMKTSRISRRRRI
jgi:hypothetical protein